MIKSRPIFWATVMIACSCVAESPAMATCFGVSYSCPTRNYEPPTWTISCNHDTYFYENDPPQQLLGHGLSWSGKTPGTQHILANEAGIFSHLYEVGVTIDKWCNRPSPGPPPPRGGGSPKGCASAGGTWTCGEPLPGKRPRCSCEF